MEEKNFNEISNQIDLLRQDILSALQYDNTATVLFNRAVQKSADYVEKNMSNAVMITSNRKKDMLDCAVSKLKNKGYVAEFGVFEGRSINYLSNLLYPKTIFGFDSFFGLEEDFSLDCPKGHFSLNGILPKVNENVTLVKGSFSKTLPRWLEKNSDCFSLINIDCDTYEATSTVLNLLGPTKIVSGTFIIFDEYFGYHGWENHEFKAWQEYCKKNNIKYRYVAVCHLQVLVEIL